MLLPSGSRSRLPVCCCRVAPPLLRSATSRPLQAPPEPLPLPHPVLPQSVSCSAPAATSRSVRRVPAILLGTGYRVLLWFHESLFRLAGTAVAHTDISQPL
ncbi:hypothetical protein ACP4OV_010483 [Aristida adscensionis]